jgi:hypothetical protein
MSVRVKVNKNEFGSIAAKLPIARRTILARRGAEMRDIAARLSRVDTGLMRDSWAWRETNAGGVLNNDVPYTVHNEYGTYKMRAQPMARPAAEQVFPQIVSDFQNLEEHLR